MHDVFIIFFALMTSLNIVLYAKKANVDDSKMTREQRDKHEKSMLDFCKMILIFGSATAVMLFLK